MVKISIEKTYFNSSDPNEVNFYYDKIVLEIGLTTIIEPPKKMNAKLYNLNKHLSIEVTKSEYQKLELVKLLSLAYKNKDYNKELLLWINKEDERLVYWVWRYLQTYEIDFGKETNNPIRKRSNSYVEPYSYQKLGFPTELNSTKERYDTIYQFFKQWNHYISLKIFMILDLKNEWSNRVALERFKWLDPKNKIQSEWFFDYMNDSPASGWGISKPENTHEMYLAGLSLYDAWKPDHPDQKKLMYQNMRKAWSQKKYRDSIEGKLSYNMLMDKDVKDKLSNLAKLKGVSKNKFIEWLIMEEDKNRAYMQPMPPNVTSIDRWPKK
ncbi:hypothetical protein [Vibrio sp. VB16]|uniref:hypothetical protein n=1 Tax=Vibrio sp. VB16 TaxID=2785746 RepID=UPI00189DF051|nr:hypothetical protein [Vibrio sp. VB16]UGA53717.1 hypothetical protein IUZ65_010470 [Vibrio sp. VB16]